MAAVLLKVDFCWQHGYIKQPVTSEACVWKQPSKQMLTCHSTTCQRYEHRETKDSSNR